MLPLALMRRALFSDTSFLYAQADEADSDHLLVVSVIEEVLRQKRPIVVTTFIIAETHALILRRLGRDLAASWLQQAYESFIVIRPTEEDERRACEIIFGYTDKDFSFTDAISFRRYGTVGHNCCFVAGRTLRPVRKVHCRPIANREIGTVSSFGLSCVKKSLS